MHATPDSSPVRYKIADLVLDTGSRRVTRGGTELNIGGLTFDFLQALAEMSPSMVSYDTLAERVWDGRPVSPETISQRAKMLRDALSDDAKSPRYLELVRGQGYRLVTDAVLLNDTSSLRSSRRPLIYFAAAALAAVLMLAVAARLSDNEPTPSVAVLPFVDMSEAGDQRYLADGVAEELINHLSRLDGLDVASRTESFLFRSEGADLKDIGRQLKVTAILEGSIRRSDNNIRITVQLIDVDSGYHLWSQNFDRELSDIFAIQDEIAMQVAGALGVRLGVGTVNEFFGAGTRNIDAYDAFLLGDFARAIELDPEYAAAWGAEGLRIASTMWANPAEDAPAIIERAMGFVAKAVELDPQSFKAHTDFATVNYATNNWDISERSFMRALSLRRDPYTLVHYANMLMRTGRSMRAAEIHEERNALLRLPQVPFLLPINVDIALGRLDQAREQASRMSGPSRSFAELAIAFNQGSVDALRAAIDAMPKNSSAYRELLGPISGTLDEPDQILRYLEPLASDPNRMWPTKFEHIALIAAFIGEPEFAFDVFYTDLSNTRIRYGTLWYPVMSDVRKLPAFKTFVREMNLDDYWREFGWPDFCWPYGDDDFECE